ncbi:Phospholipase A2 [Eumeta japonica]|uniref:Phospholipase A2 n=1 Tax=Eumeta variegata TaxID=151549 RepID=A0A4C1YIV2_EUMVA|nr:Phospholipase A2 [Eumeta japonica]
MIPDPLNELNFAAIYNSTDYPQLRYRPRVYQHDQKTDKHVLGDRGDDTRNEDNLINDLEYSDKIRDMLLVGFSHDPYRNSIVESDYGKKPHQNQPIDAWNKDARGKRGVLHLYNMISCATGCDPVGYKGYGCYCGFLGSGRPADGIDRCCKVHDQCYENIYCPVWTVYFQPYYWKCIDREPRCALENRIPAAERRLIGACAARLCECDRQLAMCLRKYSCPRRRALCRSSPFRLLQNLLLPR